MLKSFFSCIAVVLLVHFGVAQRPGLVEVRGHQFYLDGKPYKYIGVNYWYGGLLGLTAKGKLRLQKELDFLVSKGVYNLRVLAAGEGEGMINGVNRVEPVYQPQKGVFKKDVLVGLDYLLVEMGKRNMKAVLYLSNNWDWSGGFLQYLNWNGVLPDTAMRKKIEWEDYRDFVSKFYSCEPCIEQERVVVKNIVNRVNTITGKQYKDDAAIMSWELANEPRPMRPAALPLYKKWISTTAAFIKGFDKHHLVTTGAEGDIGMENMDNFEFIHADKHIDYATIHIWPKNWGWFQDTSMARGMDSVMNKTRNFISRHQKTMAQLNKPLVIEEFGMPRDEHKFKPAASTNNRDRYYRFIFEILSKNIAAGGVINGANFWGFGGMGRAATDHLFWQRGDDMLADPPMEEQGLNTVFDTDASTWKIVETYTRQLKK